MKGVVIERGEKYYTYLKKLFLSINNLQRNYNWLISSYECWPCTKKYAEMLSEDFCWMTGEELTEMIECEDFQWIWGALSAFSKDIPKEKVLQYDWPKADGCGEIWQLPVDIQHPLAEIEIVAWDSSMTVFISKEDYIVDLIRESYEFAEDLEKYINLNAGRKQG